jgi:hypothetical protein
VYNLRPTSNHRERKDDRNLWETIMLQLPSLLVLVGETFFEIKVY